MKVVHISNHLPESSFIWSVAYITALTVDLDFLEIDTFTRSADWMIF